MQKAHEQLLQLKRQQEQIEKQKRELEELSRRQGELEQGRAEMTDKLTRSLVVLEREAYDTQKKLEQLRATRESSNCACASLIAGYRLLLPIRAPDRVLRYCAALSLRRR